VSHLALVVAGFLYTLQTMQSATIYAAAGALVGAFVVSVIYHVAIARPAFARLRKLFDLHDGLIAGGNGNASVRLNALEGSAGECRTSLQRLSDRVGELEALSRTDLSRAGFVRYDAFTGSGSGLSYALALLDRQGDGVVLTSIYSREDTRTYGKPVTAFKPTVQASSEELEAIERARQPASSKGAPL
jgi:Protein of unknown function (DUF4446)